MLTTMKPSLVKVRVGVVALLLATSFITNTVAAPAITRAQAIAIVRKIINLNAKSCRISKTNSITAIAAGRNWRVTARTVMSACGRPVTETAVWTVRADGEAVAANQLTAEIGNGCP